MCRHFITVPEDELTRIIRAVKAGIAAGEAAAQALAAPSAAPPPEAFPKSRVPVLLPGAGGPAVAVMHWGYPVSWQRDVVFNTRAEKAAAPGRNMWTDSLRQRRCLVPSYGFFESHATETAPSPKTGRPIKAEYRFTLPGSPLLFMAGIYEEDHFSIMTTAPSRWVAPIHHRMPVVLPPAEWEAWLSEDYEGLLRRDDVELVARRAGA